MIKIVKTIAVAVAVTCMFAMTSDTASAQCSRGGFNSGFVGGGFSSGFRGSSIGGFNNFGPSRGLNINISSGRSFSNKNLYRAPVRVPVKSFSKRGFGY